jgi:hypothetical protein
MQSSSGQFPQPNINQQPQNQFQQPFGGNVGTNILVSQPTNFTNTSSLQQPQNIQSVMPLPLGDMANSFYNPSNSDLLMFENQPNPTTTISQPQSTQLVSNQQQIDFLSQDFDLLSTIDESTTSRQDSTAIELDRVCLLFSHSFN